MMEWSEYILDEFSWEVLKLYIKHGYGDFKLYNTTFFSCNLSDETACMTLKEFAENAIDNDDFPWVYKDSEFMEWLKSEAKE